MYMYIPHSPHYQDPGYFDQDQGNVRGRTWKPTNNTANPQCDRIFEILSRRPFERCIGLGW